MNKYIYERVKSFCDDNSLIEKNDGIVAGISGGADSVFLFLYLLQVQKEYNLRLCFVHVNHGIRGSEADRDERFVEELCEQNGVMYKVFYKDIPKMAQEMSMTEEEAGRVYRYECFEDVRKELGYNKIAVAHHQDDQAETVLFQLLRGSGFRGLGGMRAKNTDVIRPLLAVKKQEIVETLEKKGQSYCTDSTNNEDEYARNQIRNHLIPYLRENLQKETVSHIAKTASYMQDVTEFIDLQTDMVWESVIECKEGRPKEIKAYLSEMKKLHVVLQREIFMRMIEYMSGRRKDITARHIDALTRLIISQTGRKINLPYDIVAAKYYDCILMSHKDRWYHSSQSFTEVYEEKISAGQEYNVTFTNNNSHTISFHTEETGIMTDIIKKNSCTKWFDYAKIKNMPELRYPKEGDYLWLRTDGSKKKLSRILIDSKIPADERKNILVLADGAHIMWIPELSRCSAYYYINDKTKKMLCASIH